MPRPGTRRPGKWSSSWVDTEASLPHMAVSFAALRPRTAIRHTKDAGNLGCRQFNIVNNKLIRKQTASRCALFNALNHAAHSASTSSTYGIVTDFQRAPWNLRAWSCAEVMKLSHCAGYIVWQPRLDVRFHAPR